MDPHILDLILKIASSGGLALVSAVLLYFLGVKDNDLKKVQEDRVTDAKAATQSALNQAEKANQTFEKVTDVMSKIGVEEDKSAVKILTAIDKLNNTIEDIEKDLKDLKGHK